MGDLKVLPFNGNYIQNRIDRFHQEFLSHPDATQDIEKLIGILAEYMGSIDQESQSDFLYMSMVRLNEAVFWLHNHNSCNGDVQTS